MEDNPLRHIDSSLFVILKTLKSAQFINFSDDRCINQLFNSTKDGSISKYKWNGSECNDVSARTDTQFLLMEAHRQSLNDDEVC